jgi:hypothetical protein
VCSTRAAGSSKQLSASSPCAPHLSIPRWAYWRATFYVTGMAHSVVGGSAQEPTPWRAGQQAAWGVVNKPNPDE